MDSEIALIEYSTDARIWRLFSPGRDKSVEMSTFVSIRNQDDLEAVTGILHSWGFAAAGVDWAEADGRWVVPIQRLRKP